MRTLCHCLFVPFVGCSWFFFSPFSIIALIVFEFCFYRVVSSFFFFPSVMMKSSHPRF